MAMRVRLVKSLGGAGVVSVAEQGLQGRPGVGYDYYADHHSQGSAKGRFQPDNPSAAPDSGPPRNFIVLAMMTDAYLANGHDDKVMFWNNGINVSVV